MAGIYIHIPYCHKACNYCNFHFSTNLGTIDKMVESICKEIELKSNFLEKTLIETIYLGGGTPSVLSNSQLNQIFEKLHSTFTISKTAEQTLEANPEDLTSEKIHFWKSVGINRFSIGIQSFQEDALKWMNRNHTSKDSLNGIKQIQDSGVENISIDLIYGLPQLSNELWRTEIQTAIKLNVPHISSYCLTVEDKTALGSQIKKGLMDPVSEALSETHFLILMEEMERAGYEHYEISNFCKPTFESKHNTSYWKGIPYIGIGPGAHSYNLATRQFNVSNNSEYIRQITIGIIPFTEEVLTNEDHYNEYILTRLRTKWGIHLNEIVHYNPPHLIEIQKLLLNYTENGLIYETGGIYRLSQKGKLLADEITLHLMA